MATSSHLDSIVRAAGHRKATPSRRAVSHEQREKWLPQVGVAWRRSPHWLSPSRRLAQILKAVRTTLTEQGGRLVLNGDEIVHLQRGDCWLLRGPWPAKSRKLSLVLVAGRYTRAMYPARALKLIAPHVLGDLVFDNVHPPRGSSPGENRDRPMELVLATLAMFPGIRGGRGGRTGRGSAHRGRPARCQPGAVWSSAGQAGAPVAATARRLLETTWRWRGLLTYQAAASARRNPAAALNRSSMAKVAATEAASRVV